MPLHATPVYRFGDVLALARRSWTLRMAREMAERDYHDYRVADAAVVRMLLRGPAPVGRLGVVLGVSRQAARKVARGLEQRELAVTEADPDDARKVNVRLTEGGVAYGRVMTEVIASLNREVAARIDPAALVATDHVLRTVIDDRGLTRAVGRIPPPRV
jgi:DNA-binding MarR family transcriptional regulator